MSSSSEANSPVMEKDEKKLEAHIEQIHTNEKVAGNPQYYEKDGLRTYGDDEDHDHEPRVCDDDQSELRSLMLTLPIDVFSQNHEPGGYGFHLDR